MEVEVDLLVEVEVVLCCGVVLRKVGCVWKGS